MKVYMKTKAHSTVKFYKAFVSSFSAVQGVGSIVSEYFCIDSQC